MRTKRPKTLRRRALRIDQDPSHPLYMFSLSGEEILQIADISRISRNEKGKLIGYQRPEVKRHIQNIVEYLDSGNVIFPNSVILALSSDAIFKESRGPKVDTKGAIAGTIEIPLPQTGEIKPAWIVDGQQRTLALTQSNKKQTNFHVPVNAFIADDIDVQRDQFLRVNTTRPLPRGLIDELLPEVSTILPASLAARKIPAALCELLNQDPESPFHNLVKRTSSNKTSNKAVVSDTVIIKMLQESLSSPSGVLFPHRNVATGVTDFNSIRSLLIIYWNAVQYTFPEAWGKLPEKSRLMHGAGIRAMGRLMDRVMAMIDIKNPKALSRTKQELGYIKPFCRWSSGSWEELGGLNWNEIQNLPSHHRMLSNFLIRTYINNRRSA